jgi:hypothetical protein
MADFGLKQIVRLSELSFLIKMAENTAETWLILADQTAKISQSNPKSEKKLSGV